MERGEKRRGEVGLEVSGSSFVCIPLSARISCCSSLFFSCSSSNFCIHMFICFSRKFDFCISVSYLFEVKEKREGGGGRKIEKEKGKGKRERKE